MKLQAYRPTTQVIVKYLGDMQWEVVEDIVYRSAKSLGLVKGEHLQPKTIIVRAGFVTDFASIPRGLWNIFPPTGNYAPEAVLHDYMYVHAIHTKRVADKLFRLGMKARGIPRWKRWVMWASVSIFGKGNYP